MSENLKPLEGYTDGEKARIYDEKARMYREDHERLMASDEVTWLYVELNDELSSRKSQTVRLLNDAGEEVGQLSGVTRVTTVSDANEYYPKASIEVIVSKHSVSGYRPKSRPNTLRDTGTNKTPDS